LDSTEVLPMKNVATRASTKIVIYLFIIVSF
jgi:hypothetical protein